VWWAQGCPVDTAKNTSPQNPNKNPKSSTFSHIFGEGSPRKEPQGVHVCVPPQTREGEASNPLGENRKEIAPKITEKEKRDEQHNQLRNHVEASIHQTKVHTRFSLPPNHPFLSQDLS
jgi:hypothetical protein